MLVRRSERYHERTGILRLQLVNEVRPAPIAKGTIARPERARRAPGVRRTIRRVVDRDGLSLRYMNRRSWTIIRLLHLAIRRAPIPLDFIPIVAFFQHVQFPIAAKTNRTTAAR